jgi:hypothetical protein
MNTSFDNAFAQEMVKMAIYPTYADYSAPEQPAQPSGGNNFGRLAIGAGVAGAGFYGAKKMFGGTPKVGLIGRALSKIKSPIGAAVLAGGASAIGFGSKYLMPMIAKSSVFRPAAKAFMGQEYNSFVHGAMDMPKPISNWMRRNFGGRSKEQWAARDILRSKYQGREGLIRSGAVPNHRKPAWEKSRASQTFGPQ